MMLAIHPWVGMLKSVLRSNYSTSCTSFMDSLMILHRPLTNEYVNAVRLIQ